MREQTRACLRGVASRPGHEWISTGLQQAVTLVDGRAGAFNQTVPTKPFSRNGSHETVPT